MLIAFQTLWCVGPRIENIRPEKVLSLELEVGEWEGRSFWGNWVLGSMHLLLCSHVCLFPLSPQLPHMPHISECLMKRSLKPADLRDMTIGQLQVIVNDLHSQIESKCKVCLQVE